ncbi:MAG: HTH domain-containing protein [Planctomycetota bacterium]
MAELQWKEAIEKVLAGQSDPVHYVKIAELVAQQGLKKKVGATPAASVAATLSMSLKNDGDKSPFEKVGKGLFRLRQPAKKAGAGPKKSTPQPVAATADDEPEPGLINAFGMYWRRELVDWALANPKLLGQQQEGSTSVDFANQQGVYLLHDGREVVYVGRSEALKGIGSRLRAHTKDRHNGRWDRFSWFGVLNVKEDGSLDAAPGQTMGLDNLIDTMEALLIEAMEPPQNRKRGDGFSAVEFIQVPDPDLEKKRKKQVIAEMLNKE